MIIITHGLIVIVFHGVQLYIDVVIQRNISV